MQDANIAEKVRGAKLQTLFSRMDEAAEAAAESGDWKGIARNELVKTLPVEVELKIDSLLEAERNGDISDPRNASLELALEDKYDKTGWIQYAHSLPFSEKLWIVSEDVKQAKGIAEWYFHKHGLKREGCVVKEGTILNADGSEYVGKFDFDLFSYCALRHGEEIRRSRTRGRRIKQLSIGLVLAASILGGGNKAYQFAKDEYVAAKAAEATRAREDAERESAARRQALADKTAAERIAGENAAKAEYAQGEAKAAKGEAFELKSSLIEVRNHIGQKEAELADLQSRIAALRQDAEEMEKDKLALASEKERQEAIARQCELDLQRKQNELDMTARVKKDLEGLLQNKDEKYKDLITFYNRNVGQLEVQDRAIYELVMERWQKRHAEQLASFKASVWLANEGKETVVALQQMMQIADEHYQSKQYFAMSRALNQAKEQLQGDHADELDDYLGVSLKAKFVEQGIVANEKRRLDNERAQVCRAFEDIYTFLHDMNGKFTLTEIKDDGIFGEGGPYLDAIPDKKWLEENNAWIPGNYESRILYRLGAGYLFGNEVAATARRLSAADGVDRIARDDYTAKAELLETELSIAEKELDAGFKGRAGRFTPGRLVELSREQKNAMQKLDWKKHLEEQRANLIPRYFKQ